MKIIAGKESIVLSNDHPYAQTILLLARNYQQNPDVHTVETEDITELWNQLEDKHKQLLRVLAKADEPLLQLQLEKTLDIDWYQLRGNLNGITRICNRVGFSNPVKKQGGHNAKTRYYYLDDHIVKQVLRLSKAA